MKLHSDILINGKPYKKGANIPGLMIYPFFLIHMLAFGGSGFFMAYNELNPPIDFLYMHGGFAILIYTIFYLVFFGVDEVKWMFINGALGLLAIYSQIDWILSLFDRQVSDFQWYVHVIPFLYFILYTFMIRQALIDLTRSRNNARRKKFVEYSYVTASVIFYLVV
jgi:hypothetical protein